MAAQVRAASKVLTKGQQTLDQVQAQLATADNELPRIGAVHSPEAIVHREQASQALDVASPEHERLTQQREQVGKRIRAIGQAYHFVDRQRGIRRNGQLMARDMQAQIEQIRTIAQHEGLSQACADRIEKAERVVPKMQATVEFVSGYVRQQVRQLDSTPPASYAMHAPLIPAYSLDRVAQTRTVTEGEPLRELAERLRAPLFGATGVLSQISPEVLGHLHHKAQTLADVFQRSSSNVEGRTGDLSLCNHQLRGLGLPRKRECLTTMHNFFLTRADGTTAAERFFGQKPRSMHGRLDSSNLLSV